VYVLFEGVDRAGKSTQIELLQSALADLIVTKEPGATPLGQKIRQILLHEASPSALAELFLFLADRAEHIQKVIKPNKNRIIISDRGYLSGIAYAHVKSGIDLEQLIDLNRLAMQGVEPDLIVFFSLTPQELRKRFATQPLDSIEQRGIEYLLRVQDIMKELLKRLDRPYIILDATKSKEEIFHDILPHIRKHQ